MVGAGGNLSVSEALFSVELESLNNGGELLCAHCPSLMKAHLLMLFAVSHRPVTDASAVFCLTCLIFKCQLHGHEGFLGWLPCFRTTS